MTKGRFKTTYKKKQKTPTIILKSQEFLSLIRKIKNSNKNN